MPIKKKKSKTEKQIRLDEIAKLLEYAIANSGYCDEDYLKNRIKELEEQ